jgi:hypothetical protein
MARWASTGRHHILRYSSVLEGGIFIPGHAGGVAERSKATHVRALYGQPYRRFESFPPPPLATGPGLMEGVVLILLAWLAGDLPAVRRVMCRSGECQNREDVSHQNANQNPMRQKVSQYPKRRKGTPKMVEMAAKQTIVEEIVRNAYFKFSETASVTIQATRRGQLDPSPGLRGKK